MYIYIYIHTHTYVHIYRLRPKRERPGFLDAETVGRLCDSTGNRTLTPKRQGGMIEEPPDPIEQQGPVGGGDPESDYENSSRETRRERLRELPPVPAERLALVVRSSILNIHVSCG